MGNRTMTIETIARNWVCPLNNKPTTPYEVGEVKRLVRFATNVIIALGYRLPAPKVLSDEEVKGILAEEYNLCEAELLPDCPEERNIYTVENVATWPSYHHDFRLANRVAKLRLKER